MVKSFYTINKTISKMQSPPTEWDKIFAKHTSDNGLMTKIHKEIKEFNSQINK